MLAKSPKVFIIHFFGPCLDDSDMRVSLMHFLKKSTTESQCQGAGLLPSSPMSWRTDKNLFFSVNFVFNMFNVRKFPCFARAFRSLVVVPVAFVHATESGPPVSRRVTFSVSQGAWYFRRKDFRITEVQTLAEIWLPSLEWCWLGSKVLKVARPSCDVDGQWSPAEPETNRDWTGPRFRVQQTAPWPIHWMQRSCTEPDGVWSPYLGRSATVSMTVGDTFVRRAKTSTVTPIFFFLSCKRNVSGRLWRFLKKILGTVFLLQRFGLVNPWTCNWNTYKSLQKTEVFDLSFWKNEHGDPQFFSHVWSSHKTKDRYWKNQPISR